MKPTFDILAFGNAIVDIVVSCDDQFLIENNIEKSVMSLIGHDEFSQLYDSLHRLENPRLVSGGSAANTAVGVVALGGSASFVGRVFDDHLGRAFRDDILAAGVEYEQALASKGLSTASSIIFVTPDAERSMKTFLGASIELEPQDINNIDLDQAKIIYLEGYLFDAPSGSKIFSEVARKPMSVEKLALSFLTQSV